MSDRPSDDDALACVQDAVRLAKDRQIRNVEGLKIALINTGWSAEESDAAIQTWANYEQGKSNPALENRK